MIVLIIEKLWLNRFIFRLKFIVYLERCPMPRMLGIELRDLALRFESVFLGCRRCITATKPGWVVIHVCSRLKVGATGRGGRSAELLHPLVAAVESSLFAELLMLK